MIGLLMNECGAVGGMITGKGNRSSCRKTALVITVSICAMGS
jgi:hypothetical protein